MILFGGRDDAACRRPPAACASFMDDEAYLSSMQDQALAQETTVFCTAHCPENRYLLAASNQGRLAVWDLTSYLFPSHDQPHQHPHTYTDRPVLSPAGLGRFPRQLQPGQARLHPGALVRQGWPRLSLQVSDRAVNSIAFTPPNTTGKGGPLLVLAGDEAVFMYEWAAILALLEPDAPATGAETVAAPAPRRVLRALPAGAAKSWPYLTESNCVALGWAGGLEAYSAGGDAAVRCWDLEQGKVTRCLQGHTGYVHAVQPVPAAKHLVLSGGEDGVIRVWDTRTPGGSVQQTSTDPWPTQGGGNAYGGSKPAAGGGGSGLQGSKWVSALAADNGGNFVVAGGGVEQGAVPGGKGGFVAVFHLPSMAAVSAAATPSFVQDVCFLEDKIVSAGNEATVTHWTRPALAASARVTTDLPSVFSVNARAGPPQGDGVTVYAGCKDYVSVFINPESRAFNLKFR